MEEGLPPDEQFASVLAAWDEALAAGTTPGPATGGSPELWSRLERGLACLQRLQGLRPRRPSDVRPAADTPRPESPTLGPADASPATVQSAPEPGRRYTLTSLHATGGIGRVWLAYDSDLGREVALKELRPERSQDRGFADRFLHEARITGQLEHPGIVPVYELTRRPEGGQPFYTMRFIKGRTLTEAIRAYHDKRAAGRAEPLEQAALLNAFVATCNAVAYAHSRGVIHRDLKGQNVVLGDFGEVVVLDWGFAKVVEVRGLRIEDREEAPLDPPSPILHPRSSILDPQPSEAGPGHTVQGQVIGTPAYMAPEQAEGRADRIDRRSDVYGLGAILYELLTGRPPFAGAEVAELLRQVREAEPPRPRQVWAGVPRALEAVCLRALAKDPARRYRSAAELARDVQRWLADEPVAAYREPVAARLGRWARRHQALAAGLAALLVSAVLGAVVVREELARNEVRVQAAEKVAETERKARAEVATAAYLKHVALAQEAVSARQLARADELLERCESGLRDWEWHHLQRRTHRCLHTLREHTRSNSSAVYSPDGRQIASATDDGRHITIWDATTGRYTTLPGHAGGVFRLAYRPPDGRHLASAGVNDGKVRVWDTATGREVFTCAHDHRAVLGVAYSPDGRQLASSSWDKTVVIWDAADGHKVRTLVRHTHELGVVAFRPPDGRELAVVAFDNTVTLWDLTTGRPGPPFASASGLNTMIAFRPDGERLAVCGAGNRIVTVWDVTKHQEIWALPGQTAMLPAVAFSPDGRLVATASADQAVRILDAATGRPVRTLRGHRARHTTAAFSPDGRQLATAGHGPVKIWDVTDPETDTGPESLPLGRHAGGVRGLAFSPDGASLASAGADGTVKIWDATTGRQPHAVLAFAPAPPVPAALVNAWVAAAGPELLVRETFQGHRGPVAGVAFSRDGKRLASAGEDGTVVVRDATTGGGIVTLPVPAGPVRGVVFSADGRRLATAGGDKAVTVWDAASGRAVRTLPGDGADIHSVAFSPDDRWLAAADAVGTLRVWDADTGGVICARHAQPGNPLEQIMSAYRAAPSSGARARSASCVVFSSDGRRLAWTGADTTITVWDLTALAPSEPRAPEAGTETVTLRGHTDVVTSLAFSPDGKRLGSAGADGVVKLCDTRTGQEALTLRGHAGALRGVAFSPDGRLLAAAGDHGTILIWNGRPLDADPGR